MPRVTTDVPPQAAALQGIGHQKSTSNEPHTARRPPEETRGRIYGCRRGIHNGTSWCPSGSLSTSIQGQFPKFPFSIIYCEWEHGQRDMGGLEFTFLCNPRLCGVLDLAQLFVNAADCTMNPATLSRSRRSKQKALVPFFACCCFQWVPLLPLRAISANRTTGGSIRNAPVAGGDPCEKRNLNKKQEN